MTTPQSTPWRSVPQLTEQQFAAFWALVDSSGGPGACWLWRGRFRNGYGAFSIRHFDFPAHRIAYTLCMGPIPEGLELDHVRARGCTSKTCVNPAHLEAVTHRENCMRSTGVATINARKTHCINGHAFTPENTRMEFSRGHTKRACRACDAIKQRKYNARKAQAKAG